MQPRDVVVRHAVAVVLRLPAEIVEALEPELSAKDFKERSEQEQATMTRWYSLLSLWSSLKRAGCPVTFGRALKRQARC